MDIKTNTGAEVVINPAPFGAAMALKNAIMREIASAGIKIDMKSLRMDSDIALESILATIMQVDSSPAVNKAIMDCLQRCTYNKEKITALTFENETAREDYYEVVIECLKVNLSPFLKGLASKLNAVGDLAAFVNRK